MVFGFDDASALLSLIGFSASALNACIRGFVLLSKARSFGRDVSGAQLMIELEQHKLHTWAQEIGLFQNPPVLLVSAQHVKIVPRILGHLQELLTDLSKLQRNFGLQLEETDEEILEIDNDDTAFARLRLRAHDHAPEARKRVFRQRDRAWRVLKWVTFDADKVSNLLNEVGRFTHELQQILDQTRQIRIEMAVDTMHRNAVLNTANEQELDMMGTESMYTRSQPITAAARFKKHGLLLGVMDVQTATPASQHRRTDSPTLQRSRLASSYTMIPRFSNSDLTAMRLSARLLNIPTSAMHAVRAFGHYSGRPILLEFRDDTGLDPILAKDRMQKISAFLQHIDPSFHGLSCRGYVKVGHRYGFVFDLPDPATCTKNHQSPPHLSKPRSSPSLPIMHSLRDLYKIEMPSLNLRLSFAITILETLLQLHTSGWLHKEFRSDNVLLVDIDTNTRKTAAEILRLPLYVAGYIHARADHPQEATEPLQSEIEADLYRHPDSIGPQRAPFCKAFDTFSVGCILLEIGVWMSLVDVLQRFSSAAGAGKMKNALNLLKLRESILLQQLRVTTVHSSTDPYRREYLAGIFGSLAAAMGNTYTNVVVGLLGAFQAEGSGMEVYGGEGIASEPLLELEMQCMRRLRDLQKLL